MYQNVVQSPSYTAHVNHPTLTSISSHNNLKSHLVHSNRSTVGYGNPTELGMDYSNLPSHLSHPGQQSGHHSGEHAGVAMFQGHHSTQAHQSHPGAQTQNLTVQGHSVLQGSSSVPPYESTVIYQQPPTIQQHSSEINAQYHTQSSTPTQSAPSMNANINISNQPPSTHSTQPLLHTTQILPTNMSQTAHANQLVQLNQANLSNSANLNPLNKLPVDSWQEIIDLFDSQDEQSIVKLQDLVKRFKELSQTDLKGSKNKPSFLPSDSFPQQGVLSSAQRDTTQGTQNPSHHPEGSFTPFPQAHAGRSKQLQSHNVNNNSTTQALPKTEANSKILRANLSTTTNPNVTSGSGSIQGLRPLKRNIQEPRSTLPLKRKSSTDKPDLISLGKREKKS